MEIAALPDPLWTYSEPWLQALRVQHSLEPLQRQMYDEGPVSDLPAITHQLQDQVAQLTQLLR